MLLVPSTAGCCSYVASKISCSGSDRHQNINSLSWMLHDYNIQHHNASHVMLMS